MVIFAAYARCLPGLTSRHCMSSHGHCTLRTWTRDSSTGSRQHWSYCHQATDELINPIRPPACSRLCGLDGHQDRSCVPQVCLLVTMAPLWKHTRDLALMGADDRPGAVTGKRHTADACHLLLACQVDKPLPLAPQVDEAMPLAHQVGHPLATHNSPALHPKPAPKP